MEYYIQGDITHCSAFKNRLAELGFKTNGCEFADYDCLYFTTNGQVCSISASGPIANIIKTHPDYQELELPIEPKFKVGDEIKTGNTIETIAEVGHATRSYYCESGRTISFKNQDLWHLAPKPHYDIVNFHVGMPVLVRDYDNTQWRYVQFSHCVGKDNPIMFNACGNTWEQCIPYEGNEHLLGTADMPSEEYINW